ncbi:Undecaprenyl-phosphate mannosyltransferase [Sporomusa ovata DSM 2662]|uniref:Dolichol-phosphate mannosyltransferase n=1 Tax=Sporomusa ovata TaxID=2378 RepID=A0A0U1KXJ1_9FIRM|nr:polyprenol monophosphomannose synthase [Sporomusa ovata]EQB28639.1 glycosyl transferase family 2 [Sporomusa ovata DSM 2662]CQR72147.1 Dolichol-phosphate mannosyltransferase [Sporomusa ovata]
MKLVIIPTYNEKNNIRELLGLIYKYVPDSHVLVVDDGSPDGTGDLIETLIASKYQGRLFILKRSGKLGLGTAYIAGFKWALARKYELIFEMDADFSHNPRYLPEFLTAITDCDVVLGSRYVVGGGVTNWSLLRRFISLGGSLYSRTILSLPFHDLTGGFKCFRRKVLETINLDDVKSNGYSFQIEMTYRAFLLGFTIKEVPIVFEERAEGQSKMSSSIFREAIWMVLKLRAAQASMKAARIKPIKP